MVSHNAASPSHALAGVPAPAVRDAIDRLVAVQALPRLYARDPSLWSDDPEVQARIRDRLGWLDPAGAQPEWTAQLSALLTQAQHDGFTHALLLGMGGSSLAAEVWAHVGGVQPGGLSVAILDSTHPDAVRAALHDADLTHTLIVVASKSGSTIETACFAATAAGLLSSPPAVSTDSTDATHATHMVAITDSGSGLAQQADAEQWRALLRNPADIGGRFSALSLFGMVPAALLGLDIAAIWAAAKTMVDAHSPGPSAEDVHEEGTADAPGVQLAAFMAGHAQHGRDKLTLLLPPTWEALGDWIEQLVAESTGKQGHGIVPIVGEPLGPASTYGDDRAFVAYQVAGQDDADIAALMQALAALGHPVLTLAVPSPTHLGAEFMRWEIATALAGVLLGVNPFDEPNVTEAKEQTSAILAQVPTTPVSPVSEASQSVQAVQAVQEQLAALFARLRPGDYVALQAYLPPESTTKAQFAQARTALRDVCGVASTFGWGPRFLHSTGQLHKGGADNVLVVQLVDDTLADPTREPVLIPGRPYDFATLLQAQAQGDLEALKNRGRRVDQLRIGGDSQVAAVAKAISAAAAGAGNVRDR